MSKQKLAQMVLQKMKEKKQLQQRNRPHYQVLQLLVRFQIQHHHQLSKQIDELKKNLKQETELLQILDAHCSELQNTGKKPYPRIIVNPDFIASDNVKGNVKQFYRKASNTYLRQDIIKRKKYDQYQEKLQKISKCYQQVNTKESEIINLNQNRRKVINKKRQNNLKQDLRLRFIKQQQQQIKQVIQSQKQSRKDLLAQYQLKKGNLQNRMDWSKQLSIKIASQKQLIQKTYNPITYRNYLKRVFGIRMKNQWVQKNLLQIIKQVGDLQTQTIKYQEFLQLKNNLFIQGKATNSPSKKKRSSSRFSSPSKKGSLTKDFRRTSLPNSRVNSEFKTTAKSTGKFDKSQLTPIGRTATSSMTNLLKESSRNRRQESRSAQLVKNIQVNQ